MEQRHDMEVYGASTDSGAVSTQWVQVVFPGKGQVTITLETGEFAGTDRTPVFQFSFDPQGDDPIRIIDHRGNDIEIGGRK